MPRVLRSLRTIALIEEQEVIRKILEHLILQDEPGPGPPPSPRIAPNRLVWTRRSHCCLDTPRCAGKMHHMGIATGCFRGKASLIWKAKPMGSMAD